jgi:UDP-2,3-diacylglucosamine hydrolase
MKLSFISDIHITAANDPLYRSFLSFLNLERSPDDIIVLGGDIFDFFIGASPHFSPIYWEYFAVLKNLENKRIRIVYIEGNHDFQLSESYKGLQNIQIVQNDTRITVDNDTIYFAHGDLVDKGDIAYQSLRKILRSQPIETLAHALPGSWVNWIGATSSAISQARYDRKVIQADPNRLQRLRLMFRGYAEKKIKDENLSSVVMGHCHDLDEFIFNYEGRDRQYINGGYPKAHRSFLIWNPELRKFTRQPLPIGIAPKK